jgi:hypothetical protein
MINFIRRFLNRNKPSRGQAPEFFEVPYLREDDASTAVMLTAKKIRSICGVRIYPDIRDPTLRTVYFDSCDSKGETYPIIQYSKRTPAEARELIINVVQAMKDWMSHNPVVIVIDTKTFNKAA